ncbi:hypothetical protein D3C75_625400 [compost metagenome]
MQLALAHAQGGLHRRLVPDQGRIVPLGLIQRQYGLLQQLIPILPLPGPGHSEAAGQIEAALPGHELELQQAHHGFHLGFETGLLAGQDHGKFISPQPVGTARIGLPQPRGHRLQQAIPDLVAEQIIDLLEPLQIQHHQGLDTATLQGLPELALQGAAIAESGHGVEQGETAILQIGADQGKHQHAPHHQQDQLPDLDPEQALAQLIERGFPLLSREDLIPYLLHLAGQLGNPDQRPIEGFPLLQRTGLHLGLERLDLVKQPGQHSPQPVTGARICGLAADQEHIQPVPQQIVIQAQGLHLEGTRPIEAQIVKETLGFQHDLADVPVGVAIEHIDQLLVPILQQQPPDGREEKQQRDGREQQIVALSTSHGMTSMRTSCHTM